MSGEFSHIDEQGRARMVNVGDKEITFRTARAYARVSMKQSTLDLIRSGSVPKGDIIAAARIAGIMAAKQTPSLIPLCHPLQIDSVTIDIDINSEQSSIEMTSEVTCRARTGVEMEALTAVSVAALTVYDMCKAVDKEMIIEETKLLYKSGGRSGVFERE